MSGPLDDIVVIPLYRSLAIWAMRDTLELLVSVIAQPRFRQARVKEPSGGLSP